MCLNFLYVKTYIYWVKALSVSIISTKLHWFFKITIKTKLYNSCFCIIKSYI